MIVKLNTLDNSLLTRIAYADTLFTGYEGEIYSYKVGLKIDHIAKRIINEVQFIRKLNDTDMQLIPTSSGHFIFEIVQRDNTALYNLLGEEIFVFNAERTEVLLDENGNPIQRLEEYSRNKNAFQPLLNTPIDATISNYLGNHPKPVENAEN
tara:strand:+ start:4361 stop:4816 length:456 start_codon:yes stop_codon:yes gene_type:complete